jgi:hypothetical protein
MFPYSSPEKLAGSRQMAAGSLLMSCFFSCHLPAA